MKRFEVKSAGVSLESTNDIHEATRAFNRCKGECIIIEKFNAVNTTIRAKKTAGTPLEVIARLSS